MNLIGTKTLQTNRLTLRQFQEEDYIQAFNNYCNDERVTKYMTWYPHKDINVTKELISSWVKAYQTHNNFFQWVIVEKEIKQVIGSISVVDINEEISEVEIGYCLGYKYWNNGYVTEAAKEVIKYLFEEVNVNSIIAKHDSRNEASGKVMQKCNMMYYGQESFVNKGEDASLCVYKLTKEDYNN